MFEALVGAVGPMQTGGGGGGVVGVLLGFGVQLVILALVVAGMWAAFSKAGEPGWAAIIPIFNVYMVVKISDNALWWILLFFVPIVNILAFIKISIDVAEQFGQGLGFGLGLAILPPIFWPLLGFGDYQYSGGGAAA